MPQTPRPEALSRSPHAAAAENGAIIYGTPFDDGKTPRPRCLLEAIYVYPIKSCAPQRAGAPRPSPLPWRQGFSSLPSSPPVAGVPGEDVDKRGSGGGDDGGGGDGGDGDNSGDDSQKVRERGGEVGRASWPLGPSGLAYDREWAVVDHRDRALRLKQVRRMLVVYPRCGPRSFVA